MWDHNVDDWEISGYDLIISQLVLYICMTFSEFYLFFNYWFITGYVLHIYNIYWWLGK